MTKDAKGGGCISHLKSQADHFANLMQHKALADQSDFHKPILTDEKRLAALAFDDKPLGGGIRPQHVIGEVVKVVGAVVPTILRLSFRLAMDVSNQ